MKSDSSAFLEPLAALRLELEKVPTLRQDDKWRTELTAAIAAARACGVKSADLADYEKLLLE